MLVCEFNRPSMQDLRTKARHFEHLLELNVRHLGRPIDNLGVRRVYTINVGVDKTLVRV